MREKGDGCNYRWRVSKTQKVIGFSNIKSGFYYFQNNQFSYIFKNVKSLRNNTFKLSFISKIQKKTY